MKVKQWEKSRAVELMHNIELTIWIESSLMSDKEKEAHPDYETTGGYLKTKTMHEAWADMWHNLTGKDKKVFTDLPNFDAQKFKIITGLDV